jgi:hypothetical protein
LIEAERHGETARLIERVGKAGALDLEAAEFFIRSAVLTMGGGVLEKLLHSVGVGRESQPRQCSRGHLACKMQSQGVRAKVIRTILGPVRFERSRFVCPKCGFTEYPGDQMLGVSDTGFSPGMRRLMTRAGCSESFAQGSEDLRVYAGVTVGPKDVERVAEKVGAQIDQWMRREASAQLLRAGVQGPKGEPIPLLYVALDGTGAPMRASELANSKGKGADGRAKTREVKLGCCFTQTGLDEQQRPVRDPQTTSYVGAIEPSVDFGYRLHAEAMRRGLANAQRTVVISDGAEYNASIAREHFPQAVHIIDLYHAREHLGEFVADNTAHKRQGQFHQQCDEMLNEGKIEDLAQIMRQALPRSGTRRKNGIRQINYFTQRAEQMRYAKFRQEGLFVGSGVIEAGCKTIVGNRLKQSGMFWSVKGANAIIAARCCIQSGRFEQFWEEQAA